MPVRPTFVERLVFYRLNRAPPATFDVLDAGSFHALALAHDLGLFEALADPGSAAALADAVDADPTALAALLDVLQENGYVVSSGQTYDRTAATERWLTDEGEANLAPWFVFWRDVVFPFWDEHAGTVLREGEPPLTVYEWLDEHPDLWPTAQRGFRAAASLLVDPVVDELDVPADADSLLDLGGGHGRYAAELCERHPHLSAVVFDNPAALDVAEAEARERGLTDRFETRGGDYLADDFGEGYDLVLLFNVTHGHDPATVRELFDRAHDALAPGGRVAVLDQFEGSGRFNVGATAVALSAFTYRVTLGQSVHESWRVVDWLEDAGFRDVERAGLRRDPGSELLQAVKP